MTRRRILCVWGTRPEAIKMWSVLDALWAHRQLKTVTCVTAQHREMLDQALVSFRVRPDYDLDFMRPDQTLHETLERVVAGVTRVLKRESPDLVVVQGDTTTALGAALAAFYQRIPVAHIEAGLRTYDPYHPFPEEMNRVLVDRIAGLHFAPTPLAKKNLLREGISPASIFVTGNTVVDALAKIGDSPKRTKTTLRDSPPFLLVTVHRRENFGDPLRAVCRALLQIVRRHPIRILFPAHPNPSVQKTVHVYLRHERIQVTEPLEYGDFLQAMRGCLFILTDSGGIQEEAPSFHKPALVLREVTERPEAVQVGAARLVGTDPGRIVREAGRLMMDRKLYERMARTPNPFGDGRASERIVKAILHYLGMGPRPADWKPNV